MFQRPSVVPILIVTLLAAVARAGDPFVYTVTTTSGAPQTVQVRSDSLIHATDAVILGFGRASALANRDVTATLNYAGVRNALQLTLNADRTAGSLRYGLTHGPTDTFSAAGAPSFLNPAQVIDDQAFNDLTDPRNRAFEHLQQALNRQSYVMPLDGNPSAATAFLADQTFVKYGLARDGEPNGFASADEAIRHDSYGRAYAPASQFFQPVFWLDTLGQTIGTNGFDGYDLRFSFNAAGRFSSIVGWSLSIPIQYRQIDGAQSDTVGVEYGLPIHIVTPTRRQPFGWTVTPFVELAFNDSRDLGSTQAIFDGGAASRLTFDFGTRDQWTLALADQFTGFVGLGADRGGGDYYGGDYYGDGGDRYAFRGHVAQQLFKNGVQLTRRFAHGLSVTGSATYSTFVANAATDQWWTPRLGVSWNVSPNFTARVAYQADLANRYQSQGGDFQIDYRY